MALGFTVGIIISFVCNFVFAYFRHEVIYFDSWFKSGWKISIVLVIEQVKMDLNGFNKIIYHIKA